MGPIKPIGLSDGPLQAHGPPEAHNPPKLHGPRGHCPPGTLSEALATPQGLNQKSKIKKEESKNSLP